MMQKLVCLVGDSVLSAAAGPLGYAKRRRRSNFSYWAGQMLTLSNHINTPRSPFHAWGSAYVAVFEAFRFGFLRESMSLTKVFFLYKLFFNLRKFIRISF